MSEDARIILRKRPRSYLMTKSQIAISEANKRCGIRKGITRAELMKAMTECIPEAVKEIRAEMEEAPDGKEND